MIFRIIEGRELLMCQKLRQYIMVYHYHGIPPNCKHVNTDDKSVKLELEDFRIFRS